MEKNEDFSLRHVPLSRDACSCGVCAARNVPTAQRPAVEIYELRVGHNVTRLCAECVVKLKRMLEQPLPVECKDKDKEAGS